MKTISLGVGIKHQQTTNIPIFRIILLYDYYYYYHISSMVCSYLYSMWQRMKSKRYPFVRIISTNCNIYIYLCTSIQRTTHNIHACMFGAVDVCMIVWNAPALGISHTTDLLDNRVLMNRCPSIKNELIKYYYYHHYY